MNNTTPFQGKENCCGCGACACKCPQKAIKMQSDEYGFLYPAIKMELCISCGICKAVCPIQNSTILCTPQAAFAVQAKDEELLTRSSSGGAFATLAREILRNGGAVVGCAIDFTQEGAIPRHTLIFSEEELPRLQGSKYVQSIMGDIYHRVEMVLQSGKTVLFSRTPCEVDALQKYLGKAYTNLLTIDVICHGVPSSTMFADYVRLLEKRLCGKAIDFHFRDKLQGQNFTGSITVLNSSGNLRIHTLMGNRSSYYRLFLESQTYRNSCYYCKYAGNRRPSDITIGDYWGIEVQHPECLAAYGGAIREEKGISCLLVNTPKGNSTIERLKNDAHIVCSGHEQVAKENKQLQSPSQPHKNRKQIMEIYRKFGYSAVDAWFLCHAVLKKIRYFAVKASAHFRTPHNTEK